MITATVEENSRAPPHRCRLIRRCRHTVLRRAWFLRAFGCRGTGRGSVDALDSRWRSGPFVPLAKLPPPGVGFAPVLRAHARHGARCSRVPLADTPHGRGGQLRGRCSVLPSDGQRRGTGIDSKRFVQRFASNFETHRRQYSCRVQLQHQIQLIKLSEIVGMWEHRVRPPHTSYTKVFECGDSNTLMQSSSPSSPSTNSVSWINSSLGQRLLLVRSSDRQWLQLQLQNQLRNTCQNSIERNLLSWCSENPGRTIPSTIASALRTLSLPP